MKKICQLCFLIIFCLGLNSCVVYDTTPSKTTTRYYYGYYYGRPTYKSRPYYKPHHHHHYGAHRPKSLPNVNRNHNRRR